MKQLKLFFVEIDTDGAECDRFGFFTSYGSIMAEGDTLDELLDNATVDVIDQDGGEVGIFKADADWMQELVREKFLEKVGV